MACPDEIECFTYDLRFDKHRHLTAANRAKGIGLAFAKRIGFEQRLLLAHDLQRIGDDQRLKLPTADGPAAPAVGVNEHLRSRRARNRTSRGRDRDRKSTRLNSSHVEISYAVFCLKKKKATPASGTR